MNEDPLGYYSILGVEPNCGQAAIKTAFRNRAKILHPDVSGTGNDTLFQAAKKAYDILQNSETRAQYDGLRRAISNKADTPVIKARRWGLEISLGAAVVTLAIVLIVSLNSNPIFPQLQRIQMIQEGASRTGGTSGNVGQANTDVTVQPPTVRTQRGETPAPTYMTTQENACERISSGATRGSTMQYVSPDVGSVNRWYWQPGKGWIKGSLIAPFTNVSVLAHVPETQLVEVCLTTGIKTYIYSHHLLLGGADVARRGYCVFADGSRVKNNEFLRRSGLGPHQITIRNLGTTPAVAVMRALTGQVSVALYVDAQSTGFIPNFPSGTYRLEFSSGRIWSRKCGQFFDDRRNQRFPEYDQFTAERTEDASGTYEHYRQAEYTITPVPNGNVRPIGLSDNEFSLD